MKDKFVKIGNSLAFSHYCQTSMIFWENRTRNLAESLIVNQDFIEEQIITVENELKEIKKKVKDDKTELKEEMKIQKDRSRRNNICIEEDENMV